MRRLVVLSPPTKPVSVQVVPYTSVSGTAHHVGWGATVVHPRKRTRIYVAGLLGPVARDHKMSRAELTEIIGETICHEWAHYEQWRDGKPVIERGIAVRARNLYRLVNRPTPERTSA